MKKGKTEIYRGMLNAYMEEGEEPQREEAAQVSSKQQTPKVSEEKLAALEETLAPDIRELIRVRKGRPRKPNQEEEGYIRSSFILKAEYIEKIKEIAFIENITIKEVVEEAFKVAIESYEAKKGEIVLPSKQPKGNAAGLFAK